MLEKIKSDISLDNYNQIILIEQDIPDALASKIINNIEAKRDKNVLLIMPSERAVSHDRSFVSGVDQKDFEELSTLYRIYEFSDRVILLSKDNNYGSLFNYVDTGLITEDEMIAAILE